eukprot:CAMPEP_0184503868 /NCGR_PEP_ID=MMETSP0113_2-20130426/52143_1 /TAXON_ID=91329 /ORGANISM="Norrisiella sphaerica, Strain BC52" /LENGTH=881 /DNA_ID=CAMNT_0026893437 /DNA_START=179 /DNA_END=2824 /DNA_ORIENTATION=+
MVRSSGALRSFIHSSSPDDTGELLGDERLVDPIHDDVDDDDDDDDDDIHGNSLYERRKRRERMGMMQDIAEPSFDLGSFIADRRTWFVCLVAFVCIFLVGVEVGMIATQAGVEDLGVIDTATRPSVREGGTVTVTSTAAAAATAITSGGNDSSGSSGSSCTDAKEEHLSRSSSSGSGSSSSSSGSRVESSSSSSSSSSSGRSDNSETSHTSEVAPDQVLVDAAALISRLQDGKRSIEEARKQLEESYGNDDEILNANGLQPSKSGDSTVLVAKIKRAILNLKPQFVISVAGSSVSAGHDNMGSEAWPIVLRRNLSPIGKSLGLNISVRNQAVGGRNPNPHSLCLGPMLGEDADVVIREWQYWTFSEGFRDNTILTPNLNPSLARSIEGVRFPVVQAAGLEMFLRMALQLKSQPAVHLLFLQNGERVGSEPLRYLKKWLSSSGVLKDYVAPPPSSSSSSSSSSSPSPSSSPKFAINYFDAFGVPFDHLRKKAKKPRWQRDLDDNTHQRVYCPEDLYDDVGACPVDFYKQDGYHNGTLFINWHPGPLGHSVVGDQFAYYYMGLFQRAIEQLLTATTTHQGLMRSSKGISGGGISELSSEEGLIEPRFHRLPDPTLCNPEICQNKPLCAYSYLPKAEGPDVGDWMVNATTPDNIVTATTTTTATTTASTGFRDGQLFGWVNTVAFNQETCDVKRFFDLNCFVPSIRTSDECQRCMRRMTHLDQKRGFRGSKASGPISFKIPPTRQCIVWICEPPYEWSKPLLAANLATDLIAKVDGKVCSRANQCFQVEQTGYKQCAVLRMKPLKAKCSEETSVVILELNPVSEIPQSACVGVDGGCKLAGSWEGYEAEDQICFRDGSSCGVRAQHVPQRSDKVSTIISEVIAL